jgi:hypothetical protein
MQRIKNVTSAENLLQLLRSGRESQDAPVAINRACQAPLAQDPQDLSLAEAALEVRNDHRMLDAALHMLEHPISPISLLMPTISPVPAPLPNELLHGPQIPLDSLQTDKLLGSGFAPVSDWETRGNSDEAQTGSEDTHQDTLRGGTNNGSSRGGATRLVHVVPGNHINAKEMLQKQRNGNATARPLRTSAMRALEKIGGSTHQSVADDGDKDELSDSEDVSDAAFKRVQHRSSSGAQSLNRANITSTTATAAAAHLERVNKNKKLQRKSYDAEVDPTLPPEEVRRIRRILSNRESARRSRKRKATQISTLEDELMEVRMAATELENELIEALTNARAFEMERSQLMAEVDMLKRKVMGLEGNGGRIPVAAAPTTTTTTTTTAPVPAAAVGKNTQIPRTGLPLPPPIKIKALSASAVVPLPFVAAPIAATTTSTVDPLVTVNIPVAEGGKNRASPVNNNTTTCSPHFQSPLRQVGSPRVSHRVRFKPAVPPSFFPDALEAGPVIMRLEDIDQGLLL